jgi:hypothetical protein
MLSDVGHLRNRLLFIVSGHAKIESLKEASPAGFYAIGIF